MKIKKPNFKQLADAMIIQIKYKNYPRLISFLLRGLVEGNVFIAEKEDKTIGLIIWNNKTLRTVVVKESERGKGIGKKLVVGTMPDKDIKIVELQEENIEFYKKCGFEVEIVRMIKRE